MGALDEPWNTSGGDLALSIDAHMQADAESALAEAVERSGARGGVVVSMDPRTGDILALAEAPGFDPNRFREFDFASTRSRAFLDAAEPGSTLKAFLIAGALESGSIATDELFDGEEGAFRVPGKTIRDHRPHGLLSVADILRVSSNIGAVKIAYQIGRRTHYNMLRGFGFGEVTRSGFPEESTGLLRSWMRWGALDHATIAYGHGINVTPVQLARALAALANGGMLVEPRLVTARRPPGG
jgi:cell division protein FtsI (penicillin-binding protein 3)